MKNGLLFLFRATLVEVGVNVARKLFHAFYRFVCIPIFLFVIDKIVNAWTTNKKWSFVCTSPVPGYYSMIWNHLIVRWIFYQTRLE